MITYIDGDLLPPIHAIVIEDVDAMLEQLDIYRNPDTRFHVRTWSRECVLTPLALAVEMASFDFPKVLSVLVNGPGINPSEPYVINDITQGLHIRTNALTHLLAWWDRYKSPESRTKVLHTLLRYGADARVPALYEVTPHACPSCKPVIPSSFVRGSPDTLLCAPTPLWDSPAALFPARMSRSPIYIPQ